jgi:hypothetical protein
MSAAFDFLVKGLPKNKITNKENNNHFERWREGAAIGCSFPPQIVVNLT